MKHTNAALRQRYRELTAVAKATADRAKEAEAKHATELAAERARLESRLQAMDAARQETLNQALAQLECQREELRNPELWKSVDEIRGLLVAGKCRECAPSEWGEAWLAAHSKHRCAGDDDSGSIGSLGYSVPMWPDFPAGTRRVVRGWPTCEQCGKEYCPWCGIEKWRQCL